MTPEENKLEIQFAKLETKMDFVIKELKEMKDGVVTRLERLETGKLSASDFITYKTEQARESEDKEKRMRRLEWSLAICIGAFAIMEFYFKYLHK
jgi:hypothetical protein